MTWPHSPAHSLQEQSAYMVTSGTYQKVAHFNTNERLEYLHENLLALAARYDWRLQAWAVMHNHYHFVAISPQDAGTLSRSISHLHTVTAKRLNELDGTPGRKVWFQYWDRKSLTRNPIWRGLTMS